MLGEQGGELIKPGHGHGRRLAAIVIGDRNPAHVRAVRLGERSKLRLGNHRHRAGVLGEVGELGAD